MRRARSEDRYSGVEVGRERRLIRDSSLKSPPQKLLGRRLKDGLDGLSAFFRISTARIKTRGETRKIITFRMPFLLSLSKK